MKEIIFSNLKWNDTGNGYSRKIFMLIKNNLGKNCKVQFVKIPPNTIVRKHFHKGQTESEYVLEGTGYIKSGKKTLKLKPGILFVVDPNEPHEVKADDKGLLLFVTKANYSEDTEWCE